MNDQESITNIPTNTTATEPQSTPRLWVEPTFERILLREALNNPGFVFVDVQGGES